METLTDSACATENDRSLPSLLSFALRGLTVMKDPDSSSFCHRVVKTAQGLHQEGISLRYTLITALGLTEAEKIGMHTGFDTSDMLRRGMAQLTTLEDLGDLSLLCWLCAQRDPDRLASALPSLSLPKRVESMAAFRHVHTMELSWLLTALAHLQASGAVEQAELSTLADTVFRLLLRNQGSQGLFGHVGQSSSLSGSLRSRLGSFADQVYPIYALAHYAQAFDVPEALASATRCADTLCSLQGPLGQWWWHYDSARGSAVGHYPVYSVHQDGMAPMALFALSRVAGNAYERAAYKGLNWIYGENELGTDVRDSATGLIWRCFRQHKIKRYSSEFLSLIGVTPGPSRLRVLHECRPYHLGWLLYAFCPQVIKNRGDFQGI